MLVSTGGGASADECQRCGAGTWSDVVGANVVGLDSGNSMFRLVRKALSKGFSPGVVNLKGFVCRVLVDGRQKCRMCWAVIGKDFESMDVNWQLGFWCYDNISSATFGIPCHTGKWSPCKDSTSCQRCAVGRWSDVEGAVSRTVCRLLAMNNT